MKANETPEKLYVDAHDNLSDSILYGFTEKRTHDDIEYIRTDAFIEKACEYLMDYEFNDSPTIADRRKRVDKFIKYMKGEQVMDEKQGELCEKCMSAPINSKERAQILTECRSQSCWYKGY